MWRDQGIEVMNAEIILQAEGSFGKCLNENPVHSYKQHKGLFDYSSQKKLYS